MARTIPSPTSGRTIPAADAGGGGGGGGNPWKDWVELPLDPTDNYWKLIKNGNSANADVTAAKVGDNLQIDFGTKRNYQIQGATNNGVNLISKAHIDWWSAAGINVPSGKSAHQWEPEAVLFKLEIQFEGVPANGLQSSNYGYQLSSMAGITAYTTDQSDDPGVGGTGILWGGGHVEKYQGGNPLSSVSTSMFRSGHRTYFTNSATMNGKKWIGQSGSAATDNDSVIFSSTPLGNEAEGTGKKVFQAGGYSQGDKFGRTYSNQFAWRDSFGTFNDRYLHIAIMIGSVGSGTTAGTVKIKKIRYLIQPISNREPLT